MRPLAVQIYRRLLLRSSYHSRKLCSIQQCHQEHKSENKQQYHFKSGAIAVGLGSFITTALAYKSIDALVDNSKTGDKVDREYTTEEVSKHNTLEKGVWVTYRGNVYDITNFIKHHPGGSHTIMMGAGGDVESFWQTYKVHQAVEVQNLLETYKIGRLKDVRHQSVTLSNQVDSPYACDPIRSEVLQVLTKEPFNAQTPPQVLIEKRYTNDEIFFVRNHLPVPEIDLEDYKLSVCIGTDRDPDGLKVMAELTLDDLKQFPITTVESVVQCSGNRRKDLKAIKEIKGLDWSVGAIGNAQWTGVKLVDLLTGLGIQPSSEVKHVQVEGLDCDMSGQFYGASISADVALDPNKDVILAFEMNGKPLSRDHGFPLRFIVPGVTGARNVKWLSKVVLSHEESHSHWQRNDYKSFSPNVDMFNLDYRQAASIQEMPIQSAICSPSDGETVTLSKGQTTVPLRGYAYSGGGKMIVRVDVSCDAGKTWLTANLDDVPKFTDGTPDYSNRNRTYGWTRWSLDLPIPKEVKEDAKGDMKVLCRAFDSAYNSQPERAETVWNVRGVVNNSWHTIRVNISTSV